MRGAGEWIQKRSESMPTILLYEDDTGIRDIVTELLEEEGYGVIDAQTIEQGEAMARCHSADLFLADTTEDTRSRAMAMLDRLCGSVGREIPVVIFTCHAIAPEEAREAGCADAVEKPFDVDELLRRVSENLRRAA